MRKKELKKGIAVALVALLTVMSGSISAKAESETKNTYINSTYGYLVGSVSGIYDTVFEEKLYNSNAETTAAVSRIRAYMEVMYTRSGETIDIVSSDWIYNSNYATTYNFEMHHFYNKETKCYDGFVNTRCTAYGTADAITDGAYVVYTRVIK